MDRTMIRRRQEGRSCIPGLRRPHSVAASADGTLFVTETSNPGVLVLTPEGDLAGRYGAGDAEGSKRVDHAKGVAVDERAGLLYVAAMMLNKIEVFEIESRKHKFSLGAYGSGPGQLWGPVGLAISTRGSLLVCERMGKRVQELDPQGGSIAILGSSVLGEGKISEPRGVCCSRNGLTLVADNVARSHGRIAVYDQAGQYVKSIGPMITGVCQYYGEVQGKMLDATGVAINGEDGVIVTHRFQAMKARQQVPAEMVSEFSISKGEWIRFVGQFNEQPAHRQVLRGIAGLAVGRNGKVAVLDESRMLYMPEGAALPLHEMCWAMERVLWVGAMKDDRSLLYSLPKDGSSCLLLNKIIGVVCVLE